MKRFSEQAIRAIDLFCGAGGSSWGARAAGIDMVAAFDQWPLAGKNYAANFPQSRFYPGRLEDIKVEMIAREITPVDLILASPECTNHSIARGNKPRCDMSKNTAFQVVRFAAALTPRWIVIENVVIMRAWSRYPELKEKLQRLGYILHEQVLNSVHFGVPQTRRRLFLLCDREKQPGQVLPQVNKPTRIASVVNLNGTYGYTPLQTERRAKATLERAARGIQAVGDNKPFLMVYYGSDYAGGWQRLDRPLRTITTLDRFALVKPSPKGHLMRMLQVPELQAAMGMEGMIFPHGTRRDRIKMIGNAVCPPVMRSVIESLTRHMPEAKWPAPNTTIFHRCENKFDHSE